MAMSDFPEGGAPAPGSEIISEQDKDEIWRYVSSIISEHLRPWVFTHTYQSILCGLHNHRRKQLFLGEVVPISAQDWIALYWEQPDDAA